MALLELPQLVHERVVLPVADLRVLEHVVAMVVVADLTAQRLGALAGRLTLLLRLVGGCARLWHGARV